uniref:CUB domain-containing protein n=1 Tax=Steinernema glaseri TaxID=37863 RepID=A0A1I7ZWW3_9BILA
MGKPGDKYDHRKISCFATKFLLLFLAKKAIEVFLEELHSTTPKPSVGPYIILKSSVKRTPWLSGVFQTPNYPRAVAKGRCFLYHFAAPPHHTVRIRFDTFELEKRRTRCVDYVRIFEKTPDGAIDDDSPHDGEYCGDEITPNALFVSSSNHLLLHLNVEVGGDSRGFRGHYKIVPNEKYEMNAIELSPCEFTANTYRGSLFSPRAPYYYPSNTVCLYHVPPRRGHVARIRLLFLELPHGSCEAHFLKISDMKPKRFRDKLCFNSAPPYEIVSANGFLIEFSAGDNSEARSRGFQIEYDYVEANDSAPSPAPPLPFDPFDASPSESLCRSCTSGTPSCSCRPSSTPRSPQTRPRTPHAPCASSRPPPATPPSTRPATCPPGSWSANSPSRAPPSARSSSSARATNASRSPSSASTSSRRPASTPLNEALSIVTNELNLLCEERDHVTAHVLVGTRMSRIDDFCGSSTPPQLMSSKNLLTLDYVLKPTAPDDEQPYGFFLKYQFRTDLGLSEMYARRDESKPCQFIFNSTKRSSGNLWSPNHPGLYPRNINCNYVFHGASGQVVAIHFEYFDVEGFQQCEDSTQSDYVLFSNYQTHDRTNRRYCGRTRPSASIVSEHNYFRMMFRSNDIFEATGFYAHYQFITPKSSQTNRVKLTSSGTPPARSLLLSAALLLLLTGRPLLLL